MPKLLEEFRSGFNKLRETLFKGLFRARFRYDVFISYSHREKPYAVNLKKQLGNLDFSCFIDEEESPPGSSLDPTLAKALKKSAVLVLLATERALTRPYVVSEFEKFAATGRTIVPINILGALTKNNEEALTRSPWKIINERKIVWIDESDEAFNKYNPSPPIADGIDKLFKYTRRNVRVRAEIIGTAVLVLIAALGAGFVIKGKTEEVTLQIDRAAKAGKRADEQEQKALDAGKEAQRQLDIAAKATKEAEHQQAIAETAKKEAERQQEVARKASAEAERQQKLANDAKAEADRQLTIAQARQLASQAELTRGTDSNDLFKSTSIAKRSLELHPTLEGDIAMRKGFSLLPLLSKETPFQRKVTTVAASPNATALGLLTGETEVEIWREGKDIVRRSKPKYHSSIALSNDGSYFATAAGNKALIQDTDTQKPWEIEVFEEANITGLALSPKGKYLALIVSYEESLWVEVWERESREKVGQPVRGSTDFTAFTSVAFSSSKEDLFAVGGSEIRDGGANGFLRTWLIYRECDGKTLRVNEECKEPITYRFTEKSSLRHRLSVSRVAIASGDDYLVTANQDTALVWKRTRLADYQQIARVPLEKPLALAFDADAKHIHVISESDAGIGETDKTLKIWAPLGRGANARIVSDDEVLAVSFNQDRDVFTTIHDTYGDDRSVVHMWDALRIEEKQQNEIKQNAIEKFDISSNGNYLAVSNKGVVRVWDLTQKIALDDLVTGSKFRSLESIRLSWNGQFMALSGTGQNNQPTIMVYQRQNRSYQESSKELSLPPDTKPETVALSPGGNLLAITVLQKVILWNVKTGSAMPQKPMPNGSTVLCVVFSPDGELIASLDATGETRVWAVATGKQIASLGGSADPNATEASHNVAFSRDGRYIAVGNYDHTARVFAIATGEELMRLQHDDPVTSVSFSHNGKYLATSTVTPVVARDTSRGKPYGLWTWLIQPQDLIAETCRRSPRACESNGR